ncbi:nucleoporin p54-like isoform X2 [Convolutriloba macropyga]|uniref:nucleoporin p54-like isoform X2 n=1 Tax=Convolutriloba macropyga TaxID=536237 RepID=UPI003F51FCD7
MFGASTGATTGSLFGAAKPTAAGTLFGGAASSTGTTGGGLFGTQNTAGATAPKSLFGTGGTGGLFGTPASSSTGGLFGASAGTSQTGGGLFGTTSTTGGGGGLFGNKSTTGFGLGQTGSSTTGGLFGTSAGTGGSLLGGTTGFSLNQQKPATVDQNQNMNQLVLHASVSNPQLFADERNAVVASWNQLQASWGFGKAFYAPNAQPVDLTPENPFCRFKTVSYCNLPSRKDEDGEICMVMNKPVSDLITHQQQLIDTMFAKLFQSNQSVSITITSTKPITEAQTEVVFYVQERLPTGYSKRIPASKLHQFLLQPTQSREMTSTIGAQSFRPNKTISQQDLDLYLATPPAGLDKFLWQQAIANNPDPERLLPVPIMGFKQLHQRLSQQVQMNSQQKSRVSAMHSELKDLKRRQALSQAKLEEHKLKCMQLSHKLLVSIGLIERARKLGYPVQDDESNLYRQLQIIHEQLSQPTKLKSQLSELVSQARLGGGAIYRSSSLRGGGGSDQNYQVSADHKKELAAFLKKQQEGIANLVQMMKTTTEELKLMQNSLASAS